MATKNINIEKKKFETLILTNYAIMWQNTKIYQKWNKLS